MTATRERKPIGLLGGVFDPVHLGHINMALRCMETLDLQEVRFIPANLPPHKPEPIATQRHRLAMLECAVTQRPQLTVNEMELERGGVSYTIDTLIDLRDKDALQPLCFIMGMDAFESLPTWRRWQDLIDYAHLILIDRKRPDRRRDERMRDYYDARACLSPATLHANPCGYIYKTTISIPEISSSRIRGLLTNDETAGELLPAGVHHYIKENNLYV